MRKKGKWREAPLQIYPNLAGCVSSTSEGRSARDARRPGSGVRLPIMQAQAPQPRQHTPKKVGVTSRNLAHLDSRHRRFLANHRLPIIRKYRKYRAKLVPVLHVLTDPKPARPWNLNVRVATFVPSYSISPQILSSWLGSVVPACFDQLDLTVTPHNKQLGKRASQTG